MILVTGATGFVGRHLVRTLVSAGHPVRALVHTPSRAGALPPDRVETVQGDVLTPGSLDRAMAGVHAVVHLVAVIRERRRLTFQQVNYEGTRNVLAAASSAGVARFVHASTIGVTSDPSYPYLYSRWMAEQEVSRGGLPFTIVRFSFVFGPGDEFINRVAALIKLSPLVPLVGNGLSRFQPIAVEDAARCLASALGREDAVGKTIEAGGPDHCTYQGLVDLVAETLGARIVKVDAPVPLMGALAAIGEAFMARPPATREQLKMLALDSVAQLDSVRRAFGFEPRPLKGNIGYISHISFGDALKMNLGMMPAHVRDH